MVVSPFCTQPKKNKPSQSKKTHLEKLPPPHGHGIFLPCPLGPLRPATRRECRSVVGLETPGKSRPEVEAEWEGGGFSRQQMWVLVGGVRMGS